ncbi:ferritin family protein [Spirochaeta isovalerica]|uniref:Rubrerythrin n=1 Tax=Spirochaeta isovalerica TaxID=150 RepID=A0A841R867_9SPIO|nr:ferritin family protein [Spirochaeta isovalerica]MBB6479387.1 rubrerythrin [Spirochaeta isovalerica]
MKEIIVEEILNYSKKIELESYSFYKESAAVLKEENLHDLAEELAEEEMGHYNRLNQLLEGIKASEEEMNTRVQIAKAHYETLVATRQMPDDPSVADILEIAYQREVDTKAVYTSLSTITNLSDEIIRVFTDLMNQEEGHASRIKGLMKKHQA